MRTRLERPPGVFAGAPAGAATGVPAAGVLPGALPVSGAVPAPVPGVLGVTPGVLGVVPGFGGSPGVWLRAPFMLRGRFFCTGARILDSSAHTAEVTAGHEVPPPPLVRLPTIPALLGRGRASAAPPPERVNNNPELANNFGRGPSAGPDGPRLDLRGGLWQDARPQLAGARDSAPSDAHGRLVQAIFVPLQVL
ncbi:hypothetical protein GCM10010282_27480 [Streptomyces roseolus]|nr:hypothetical protein GCM10010282_27480 [Streptomyces roseolus]